MTFAVVRALAAAACVWLGYWLFPDHSSWAALTFVLVLQPPREQALTVGVVLAELIGESPIALALAFGLCGFLMLATKRVNYAISNCFLTAVLLLGQRLLQDEVFSTGWDRLGATVLGVAVAFAVIAVLHLLANVTRPGRGVVSREG